MSEAGSWQDVAVQAGQRPGCPACGRSDRWTRIEDRSTNLRSIVMEVCGCACGRGEWLRAEQHFEPRVETVGHQVRILSASRT